MCVQSEFIWTSDFPEKRSKSHLLYCTSTKSDFQSIVIRQNQNKMALMKALCWGLFPPQVSTF